MAEDAQALYEFVLSQEYQGALDEVSARSGISIHEAYGSVISGLDQRRVESSGLNPHDLAALIRARDPKFVDFCLAKIKFFQKEPSDRQEFPKGEAVEDFDTNETVQGYSRGMLLMYAVEFLLGLQGRQYLEAYVRRQRIPYARKYVRGIMGLISPPK